MMTPGQHTILNVDDDEGSRYAKTKIFERAGYHVLEAGTGNDALKLVQQKRPHLVLLDVGLPDINGVEVCRLIKEDVTTSHIMVLQVSASCVTPNDRVRGLTSGADVYLTEPIESAELLGAAKALLRLYDREEDTRNLLKELTERERFIKNLIDAAPSIVCLYDLRERRNVYMNATNETMLGYALRELQRHGHDALTPLVHANDLPHVWDRLACLPSMSDGEVLAFECRLQSLSMDWRWVNVRIVIFVRNAEGQPTQILGVAEDITDRKQNEQARLEGEAELLRVQQQWAAELEQKVSERTLELIHSRTRLRALASELTLTEQRERQRLATDLHDYLAQLLVFGRLKLGQAKRDSKTPWSGSVPEELDEVLAKALAYTRSLVAELSPPVLREFGLATALEWLAGHMKRQELTVTVNCDLKSRVVSEDQAVLLFQSARELLINVLKHSGTSQASVSAWINDNMLHLCVADDGAGFDPAHTPLNNSAATFGLFSIRERMEDLGGHMNIASALGQGTTVTLMVPLEHSSATSPSPATRNNGFQQASSAQSTLNPTTINSAPRSVTPQRGRTSIARVLLVDDHTLLRQGLRSALEEYQDIEVVGEAKDGEQAVAFSASLQPDIVIMDINMPVVDGIEATRQLKRELPQISVIGLSVDNNQQVQHMMLSAGAVAFLTKDTAIEQIHETVAKVLQSRM
mgnify:CR=1 FL=1